MKSTAQVREDIQNDKLAKKHRLCTICNKPIILSPSAQERAKNTNKPASFYINLFTEHSDCIIDKRSKETTELCQRQSHQTIY